MNRAGKYTLSPDRQYLLLVSDIKKVMSCNQIKQKTHCFLYRNLGILMLLAICYTGSGMKGHSLSLLIQKITVDLIFNTLLLVRKGPLSLSSTGLCFFIFCLKVGRNFCRFLEKIFIIKKVRKVYQN